MLKVVLLEIQRQCEESSWRRSRRSGALTKQGGRELEVGRKNEERDAPNPPNGRRAELGHP